MRSRWLTSACIGLMAVGCGDGGGVQGVTPTSGLPSGSPNGLPTGVPAGPALGPPPGFVGGNPIQAGISATSTGPVVRSEVAPPPINGGTLLLNRDGTLALAADPDRDRVVLVDLVNQEVRSTLMLMRGDEPGRAIEDDAHRMHVVLRRAGELASIDTDAARLIERRPLCSSPEGIAYDRRGDSLLVACASGELVSLPAAGGAATRSVYVDSDLRDVLVVGERVFVTRFKSAEVLELDPDAHVIARQSPPSIQTTKPGAEGSMRTMASEVAWRAVASSDGKIQILHQRAQVEPVALSVSQDDDAGMPLSPSCDPHTGCPPLPPGFSGGNGSPYGGGSRQSCGTIVHSAVSQIDTARGANVMSVSSGPMLSAATLAVDTAVSDDGTLQAIAIAGNAAGPVPGIFGVLSALVIAAGSAAENLTDACLSSNVFRQDMTATEESGQAIAVGFDRSNRVVVQTREPNQLLIVTGLEQCLSCGKLVAKIDLGGESRRDSGHDLFHVNAGAGLACASCHPGGTDDGHTWEFKEIGPRRTQLINIGIKDTLPLHWDGDLPTFSSLVEEVFERRMGGAVLDSDHVDALSDWINSMQPQKPLRASDDPAATRGATLFASAEVGCTNCHNGAKLTNNQNADVGTNGSFQVPSLIGVVHHAPYIHTGCAQTLRQRFDPSCGGAKHGNTAKLTENELSDLVAYLESL